MTCKAAVIEYPAGDLTCRGEYYVAPGATGALPVVLVAHAWDGLNDEVRGKSKKLAHAGYLAFAIDIYGEGKTWSDTADLMRALGPYMDNRALLLARMHAAVAAAKTLPGADTSRLGAMGYCFGGTAVLDLARDTGDDIKGVVTFHGGLAGNGLDGPTTVDTKILVLHGEDDPLVPPEQVAAFKAEMNAKKADWQLNAYSNTMHAFTRPEANDRDFGTVYNASADRRSWQAMLNFFEEVL
ncbi:MAG: dienelactone hydrolase family protein [Halioglobus sp.]|nr:dienelactone hydrolase family protein [Halioglobus sp.]